MDQDRSNPPLEPIGYHAADADSTNSQVYQNTLEYGPQHNMAPSVPMAPRASGPGSYPQHRYDRADQSGPIYPPPPTQMGLQRNSGSNLSHASYDRNTRGPSSAGDARRTPSGGATIAAGTEEKGSKGTVLGQIKAFFAGFVEHSQACNAGMPCGSADSIDEDDMKERITGNLTDAFGNMYHGQIYEGKKDGHGTIVYAKTNDRYEGEWKNDQPHGEGKATKGDGSGLFEGRWNNGTLQLVKNGFASVEDADGNHYEGSFADWKKHGKGTLSKSNGEKYTGDWVYGARHGKGVLINPDGSRFEGMFENDRPTSLGQMFAPDQRAGNDDQALSPMRHGAHGSMMREYEPPVKAPKKEMESSPLPVSNELDQMVLTDNYAPSKFKTKEEKKAAKKLVKEKKKLEKAQIEQEHKKKKQMEALLKAEVKQRKLISAKIKREQKKLDERQKLQAKALSQAKEEQEKYLADLDKQHQKVVREKMKEIERVQLDSAKKTELEKKRLEKEMETERIRIQKFEASQKAALEKQAKELEIAQRKFAMQQQAALTEQQKREQMLKMDAEQQKAVLLRKAERDAFLKKQSKTARNTKDLKKNLREQKKQLAKNKEMSLMVEGLKKKSKGKSLETTQKKQGQGNPNPTRATSQRKGLPSSNYSGGDNIYVQDDPFQPNYAQPAYDDRDDAAGRDYEADTYQLGGRRQEHQIDAGSEGMSASFDI